MKHSNSFWKRTIIGCSLLGMVIVTALPAQAAVQAATLNERTVSASVHTQAPMLPLPQVRPQL